MEKRERILEEIKHLNETKTENIEVFLSEDELDIFKSAANKYGVDVEDYVSAIVSIHIKELIEKGEKDVVE